MTSAPGKTYLLVIGVFYIAFGGISIALSFNGLLNAGTWDITQPTASGISWNVYYIILLIGSLLRITAGAMGVMYRTRLEKSALLLTIGIICFGYAILYMVSSSMIIYGGLVDGLGASLLIGLFVPALYVFGAHKNLTEYKSQSSK